MTSERQRALLRTETMRFRKYFDIENSYRKKFLDILAVEKLDAGEFVVQEKAGNYLTRWRVLSPKTGFATYYQKPGRLGKRNLADSYNSFQKMYLMTFSKTTSRNIMDLQKKSRSN